MCDWIRCVQYPVHISSRFPSTSEAYALEVLENLEEIFPHYK